MATLSIQPRIDAAIELLSRTAENNIECACALDVTDVRELLDLVRDLDAELNGFVNGGP